MGEYAEMMLDGTCCSQCGDYLGGDEGFPVMCEGCRREEKRQPNVGRGNRYNIVNAPRIAKPSDPIRSGDKMCCPFCVKRVKVSGFGDHMINQHREKWPGHVLKDTQS